MPSIETSIWLALKARVQALVLSPALPVAWPNETYEPSPSQNYLRVTWLPNTNQRLFIRSGGPHQRPSLLQIDVFARKDQNVAVALEIAGEVAAHFRDDLRMTAHGVTARVTQAPTIASPIPDMTHLMVPVTIPIEVLA